MFLILLLAVLLSLVIVTLSFAIHPRWQPWKRVSLGVGVFLSLCLALLGLVYWLVQSDTGGRPVSQEELNEAAKP